MLTFKSEKRPKERTGYSDGGYCMIYLLLIFLIIIIIQNFYIRYLKKEICLRDGTYKPKKRKSLFRKRNENE